MRRITTSIIIFVVMVCAIIGAFLVFRPRPTTLTFVGLDEQGEGLVFGLTNETRVKIDYGAAMQIKVGTNWQSQNIYPAFRWQRPPYRRAVDGVPPGHGIQFCISKWGISRDTWRLVVTVYAKELTFLQRQRMRLYLRFGMVPGLTWLRPAPPGAQSIRIFGPEMRGLELVERKD